jgi:hypothetical protein
MQCVTKYPYSRHHFNNSRLIMTPTIVHGIQNTAYPHHKTFANSLSQIPCICVICVICNDTGVPTIKNTTTQKIGSDNIPTLFLGRQHIWSGEYLIPKCMTATNKGYRTRGTSAMRANNARKIPRRSILGSVGMRVVSEDSMTSRDLGREAPRETKIRGIATAPVVSIARRIEL